MNVTETFESKGYDGPLGWKKNIKKRTQLVSLSYELRIQLFHCRFIVTISHANK